MNEGMIMRSLNNMMRRSPFNPFKWESQENTAQDIAVLLLRAWKNLIWLSFCIIPLKKKRRNVQHLPSQSEEILNIKY